MPTSESVTAPHQELLSGLADKTYEARSRWMQIFNEKTRATTELPVQTEIAFDTSTNAFRITISPYSDDTLLNHAEELMTWMKTFAPDEKFFIKILLQKNNINETLERIAFTHLNHIEDVYLCGFDNSEVSYLLSDLQQVKHLWLIQCSITGDAFFWKEIQALHHLLGLYIHQSPDLTEAPDLKGMERLEHLAFYDCPFKLPPDLEGCTSLNSLKFENCFLLQEPPVFGKLANLHTLIITRSSLSHAPDIKNFSELRVVNLSWNFMKSPPSLEGLSSLRTLDLSNTFIEYLPDLLQCPNLSSLKIDRCQRVKPQPQIQLIQRIYRENPQILTRIFNSFANLGLPWCIDFSGFSPAPEKFIPLTAGMPQAAYNEALQMAILYNLPALAKQAVNAGVDIENQFVPGSTPLLEACLFNRPEIALMLIERGANVKCMKHNTSATPLRIAREGGVAMAACVEAMLVKDAGFSEEIIWRKKLAHEFGIAGISHLDGCEIRREGFSHQFFMKHFSVKSAPFYKALIEEISQGDGPILQRFSDRGKRLIASDLKSASKRLALVEALHQFLAAMENPVNLDVIEEELQTELQKHLGKGRPAVCFNMTKTDVDWSFHIWGLVIFKQPDTDKYHVYRCNRGYGTFMKSGVLGNLFSRAEMLAMVSSYQKYTNWKFASWKDSANFFNSINNTLLKTMPHTHIPQKEQKPGMCSYYSLQAVELLVLRLVIEGIMPESAVELAKEFKRLKTDSVRLSDLQEYLSLHGPHSTSYYPPDWELLMDINTDTAAKPKLASHHDAINEFMTTIKP